MEIESKGLKLMFDIINKKHFNSLLPDIPLYFNDRRKAIGGYFQSKRFLGNIKPVKIVISKRAFDLHGKKEVYDILKHEMVHYYLCVCGKPHGHTKQFNNILFAISAKRHCLDLSTPEEKQKKIDKRNNPKWRYVCSNPDYDQVYNKNRRLKNSNNRYCHKCDNKVIEEQLR